MHSSPTSIATTWRSPFPSERREADDLRSALMRERLAAEWQGARKGLGLMAWSMTALLVLVLVGVLPLCVPGKLFGAANLQFVLLPCTFVSTVGIPIGLVGYVAGVVLSLLAPRRARLGGWIGSYVVGLVAGVVLLAAAAFWPGMTVGVSGSAATVGTWALLLLGVTALAVSLLGYSLYLGGIAERFGARRLARCFVAYFVALVLLGGLIALVQTDFGPWLGRLVLFQGARSKYAQSAAVLICVGPLLVTLALSWPMLLWRLRRLLPRQEIGEEDED